MADLINLPSNTAAGLDLVPFGLRDDDTNDWLSIYLNRLDDLQGTIQTVMNYLLTWDQPGANTPLWVLDVIGKLLGIGRPADASLEEYRRILTVQRLVRKSSGTQPNVREIVNRIGGFGTGAGVAFLTPHTVIVTFANFADVEAQGLTLPVVITLLEAAIGDVDRLQIWDAVGNAFTWGIQGQGWGQGVWAAPLYDSKDN